MPPTVIATLLPPSGRSRRRTAIRALLASIIVVAAIPVATAYLGSGEAVTRTDDAGLADRSVAPADGVTVVTSDYFGGGKLAAYRPDGSVLYYNDTYPIYHDVDPAPTGDMTVTYVATEYIDGSACHSETDQCDRSVIERVNLTTGETTRLWERTRPKRGSVDVHDVDRVGPSKYLVADIANPDRVYVIDTSTGIVEWGWDPQYDYSLASGGRYPDDWTHMNDVEQLGDGRVMVSLRNQDQVVFIDEDQGLEENWTLGADGDHSTLYEQHNPDYIPATRGGPAVLVADSENSRVIEYRRDDGEWSQSWVWQDTRLQWPRDADRLPNGNTLVVDTNGDRVVEVAPSGEVVWSVDFPGPYDVERLGTGDESSGGPAAADAGLQSRTVDKDVIIGAHEEGTQADRDLSAVDRFVYAIRDAVPSLVMNGVLYVLPRWITPVSALGLATALSTAGVWLLLEFRWAPYSLALRRPIRLRRDQ